MHNQCKFLVEKYFEEQEKIFEKISCLCFFQLGGTSEGGVYV